MKYELVLFDFDGTLANSFPTFVRLVNEAARRFGFKRIEAGEVGRLRGTSAREMIQTLGVPRWKVPLIAIYMRRRMTKEIEQVALFEGVTGMIQRLTDEGVILAVVSSNSEANWCSTATGVCPSRVTADTDEGQAHLGNSLEDTEQGGLVGRAPHNTVCPVCVEQFADVDGVAGARHPFAALPAICQPVAQGRPSQVSGRSRRRWVSSSAVQAGPRHPSIFPMDQPARCRGSPLTDS